MIGVPLVLCFITVPALLVTLYVIWRLSKRLLQFDELFETLFNDVEVNLKFFQKLLSTPLFDNSPEVKTANNNMSVIAQRMDEFMNRIEETTNRRLRKTEPAPNPPVLR